MISAFSTRVTCVSNLSSKHIKEGISMIISIDWIRDFVDIPDMDHHELATRFTMATCEVEEVKKTGELFSGIYISEITGVEKHPNANKLNIVEFSLGDGVPRKVVCGAPNVKAGLRVPFAPVGTCFPDGFTLTQKDIRGILSEGMLCSEVELGLGDDDSGLQVLPDNAPLGMSLKDFFNITPNILFDIDNKSITHRPDLWGHYGMAREFAAVFEKQLENPFNEEWKKKIEDRFSDEPSPIVPEVDPDSSCLAYYGITIKGVTIGESPEWMQRRLLDCGLRPINNIVDISNYVMLELGIPLHIFDYDRIGGSRIIIRRAGEDQQLVTLDEIERDLRPSDTVVCDAEKPLVIAGIMGGLESGVAPETNKVFVEAANWQDVEIRKTSNRLALRTDSSQRYEKALDSLQCEWAAFRAVELILRLCPEAEIIGKLEYDGHDLSAIPALSVTTTTEGICKVLGKNVPEERIISILESLAYRVEKDEERLYITVPPFRATKDVECEADIVEEIGRVIGYDTIDPVPPFSAIRTVRLSAPKKLHREIQDFMVLQSRALEVMTYPLLGEKLLERAQWPEKNEKLILINALSRDFDRMRPSLIPSILESVALNQKNYKKFTLFELGRTYHSGDSTFAVERHKLIVAYFDVKKSRYLDGANSIEELLRYLKLPAELKKTPTPPALIPEGWPGLHPQEVLGIEVKDQLQGILFTVHPVILRGFKIKGDLTLAIIDLTDFEEEEKFDLSTYQPIPRFPSSVFDCTVVAGSRVPVQEILGVVRDLDIRELESIRIADLFVINDDEKAVTLRMTFFDPKRTLPGEFLTEVQDRVVRGLAVKGFPLRS